MSHTIMYSVHIWLSCFVIKIQVVISPELRIIYLTLYIHNFFYNNTIKYNTVQFMIVFAMFPFGQGDSH